MEVAPASRVVEVGIEPRLEEVRGGFGVVVLWPAAVASPRCFRRGDGRRLQLAACPVGHERWVKGGLIFEGRRARWQVAATIPHIIPSLRKAPGWGCSEAHHAPRSSGSLGAQRRAGVLNNAAPGCMDFYSSGIATCTCVM